MAIRSLEDQSERSRVTRTKPEGVSLYLKQAECPGGPIGLGETDISGTQRLCVRPFDMMVGRPTRAAGVFGVEAMDRERLALSVGKSQDTEARLAGS
jgi:hypothetical protein